jgi:hypothetical protein
MVSSKTHKGMFSTQPRSRELVAIYRSDWDVERQHLHGYSKTTTTAVVIDQSACEWMASNMQIMASYLLIAAENHAKEERSSTLSCFV